MLLCDFGKINLKNLQKLQKLDIGGDDFVRASGLNKADKTRFKIHDQITHRAIKPIAKKYLEQADKVRYNSKARKLSFLPLANPVNQLKGGLPSGSQYNSSLERLADKVEGQARGSVKPIDGLGRAFRKKNLTKAEQIATRYQNSPIIDDLITTQRKPTTTDVQGLITEAQRSGKGSREVKKIKGDKPWQDLKRKRYDMEDRARERKYAIK
jgi:hypothetical protein